MWWFSLSQLKGTDAKIHWKRKKQANAEFVIRIKDYIFAISTHFF